MHDAAYEPCRMRKQLGHMACVTGRWRRTRTGGQTLHQRHERGAVVLPNQAVRSCIAPGRVQ